MMKPLLWTLLGLVLLGSPFAFLTAHVHTQDVSHRISTLNLSQANLPTPSPCTDFYEYVCSSVNDDLRKTGFPSVYEQAMDYNVNLLLSSLSTGRARHLSASRAVSFLVDLYQKWASEASLNRDSPFASFYDKFNLHSPSFRYVVSRVYVDAAMGVTSRQYVSSLQERSTQLAENVKSTLGRLLAPRDALGKWKLQLTPINVGYESWYMDDGQLDAWYGLDQGGLSFNHSDSYLGNGNAWMELSRFDPMTAEERGPLRVPDWRYSPDRTTAWANQQGIFLPLGYLFPAIFQHNISLASAYATVGSVAGHELLHNLHLSRNPRFRAVSQCLIAQYSSIREPQTGRTLPGAQTITEDIVDNGAIKGAFEAYRDAAQGTATLETDEQFFRSYARKFCNIHTPEVLHQKLDTDIHTLQKYRVNVVLSNFPSFSQTFSCPLGTPMNPVKKCIVL